MYKKVIKVLNIDSMRKPLHWNEDEGVVNRSLSFKLGGSLQRAIPGST